MEELLIKRQISYSCIFPNGTDTLQEIIKIIPSKSAIAWASYMLNEKKMMSINQTEADFFIPLLYKMNKTLQHTIRNYLQSISNNFSNYVFIDVTSLLILIEYLLENHNENDTNVLESENDFSNMIIAYLMCCDEKLRHTTKSLHEVSNIDSLMALYIPEQLRYNDIYYPKDYRVEFMRFYYFMTFCEKNAILKKHLELFLQEKNIKKWDDYLYFVTETYLTLSTNDEGSTNAIKIEPSFYYGKTLIDSMCIKVKEFQRTPDFKHLRSHPIYYYKDNIYSIIFMGFFIDKMFQSFLFDFASILIKHKETTNINNYPELKALVGNIFTENHLFYELTNNCFSETCKKLIPGQDLKLVLKNGEPDFYIRKGKNIFIFEFKDVMLNAKTKHCENIVQIKSEILELFESSTIEKNTGKQKKRVQAKGISQLLNVIETKLDVIIKKVDKIETTDKFNVYPIIIYQDCCFDIDGVNYILKCRFEELKKTKNISDKYLVKQCVMMSLEMMFSLEDYFHDGRLQLDKLIDNYILECNKSDQNKLLPFNKFIMKQAHNLGYKREMSTRFNNIINLMIKKNKSY